MSTEAAPPRTSRIWPVIWTVSKILLCLLVLWYVGRQGWDMWGQVSEKPIQVRWSWFAVSALLTVAAWIPCLWYWRWMMRAFGCDVPWFDAAHSYYVGHLGKYVPGKATVIVIRTALLTRLGLRPAVGAFTVTVEALTYMAAGLTTAASLVPFAAADFPQLPFLKTVADSSVLRVLVPAGIAVAGVLSLTLASRQFVTIATRMAAKRGEPAGAFPPLPRGMLVVGFAVFLAAWWIQGLGLGATIAAVSPEHARLIDWPRWTGAAAAALVGGFVVLFTPGGLGAREAVLLALLSQLTPPEAALVTVLWRAATLVGELAIVAALVGAKFLRGQATGPLSDGRGSV
ncbi:MAG: lysylphosphatidylglycerol synthase transmembrane domain-containing protein [Planctomycetota bacterium]|nr:lysylphosphatidylglycerol synthase transmembrane domain-containing protein [Planctomycetota bacterium]